MAAAAVILILVRNRSRVAQVKLLVQFLDEFLAEQVLRKFAIVHFLGWLQPLLPWHRRLLWPLIIGLMTPIGQSPDDDTCRALLEKLRWPDGVVCPRCGSPAIREVATRRQHECKDCLYRFTVTTRTLLHNTQLPLRKWFLATYLMVEAKKGISIHELGRTLGVARKTEWYLSHRIREAMTQAVKSPPMPNGGRVRGKGRGYVKNKTIVVGAVRRGGGRTRQKVLERNDRGTLHAFVKKHVAGGAEAVYIYSDEWAAYGIGDADTLDGTWSLFNHALIGSWQRVQPKHLGAYLNEIQYRAENRENPHLFLDTLRLLVAADPLSYERLTAAAH